MGGGTWKYLVGALQRTRHEAGANVLTVEAEPELHPGQKT
jgi:hypothetical protein